MRLVRQGEPTKSLQHAQCMHSTVIAQENALAKEMRQMYCKLTHLRRITLISLTQSNGLMAASLLFPNKSCTRLNGLGQVLLLQQCRKAEIKLSAVETKCGFEPKF